MPADRKIDYIELPAGDLDACQGAAHTNGTKANHVNLTSAYIKTTQAYTYPMRFAAQEACRYPIWVPEGANHGKSSSGPPGPGPGPKPPTTRN